MNRAELGAALHALTAPSCAPSLVPVHTHPLYATSEFRMEYERRCQVLEELGMTRSDAQGCVDIQQRDILVTLEIAHYLHQTMGAQS